MKICYFNYPNAAVTVHGDPSCGHIRSHKEASPRTFSVNIGNLSGRLEAFAIDPPQFASRAGLNDIWLNVDCGDDDFDFAVASFIKRLLADRYSPFGRAKTYTCACGN